MMEKYYIVDGAILPEVFDKVISPLLPNNIVICPGLNITLNLNTIHYWL